MIRPGSAARALVRVAIAAAGLAVLAAVASGCGRKGPPLVPLVRIPAPVDDLTLRRDFLDPLKAASKLPSRAIAPSVISAKIAALP